jgi:hypothetical protein
MSNEKLEVRNKKLENRNLVPHLISRITPHASRITFHISRPTPLTPHSSYLDPYLWLTLLLSLPVVGPLLQPGYFWGAHDARHSVYFLHQFDRVFRDGVWYPRWIPDMAFGYGYPFFNVYGPFSSYTGEAFHLAGLDLVTSVKIVFGLSAVLSGLAMYFFVRRLLGRPAGLIAALIYVYIPYHLFDLYVRADLAESVAFVFVPLVLWGFYELIVQPRFLALLWTAMAYAALMFTHSLSAFILTAILGLYVAYMLLWQFFESVRQQGGKSTNHEVSRIMPKKRTQANRGPQTTDYEPRTMHHVSRRQGHASVMHHSSRLTPPRARKRHASLLTHHFPNLIRAGFPLLLTLLLGLGLSAIYLLPALTEAQFVRTDQWFGGRFAFGDDFVEVFQLFSPHWGFGASIPGPDDDAGFQIGLAATILFMLSFLIVPKLADPLVRRTLYFFQGTTLVMAFLTVPLSTPVWNFLPLAQLVQFPWRLLVVIAPYISIVGGAILVGPESHTKDATPDQTGDAVRPTHYGAGVTPTHPTSSPRPSPLASQTSLPLIILSSLIVLSSYPYVQAEVRDPKPTEGPVSLAALFRFQQSADEMTGQTAWVRRIPNWSTLAEQVDAGGQITTKVNYTALPADNSVGVYSMEMDSQHELLWVGTEKEGQTVTFFVPYYPGWQAYIYEDLGPHDGNLDEDVGPVTRIGPVVDRPPISTTPTEGWMVVPIPPGSHFLEIRFEDTPVRLVGRWISTVSILLFLGLLILARASRQGGQMDQQPRRGGEDHETD